MVAKSYATRCRGGNGLRAIAFLLWFFLWLLVTAVELLLVLDTLVEVADMAGLTALVDGLGTVAAFIAVVSEPILALLVTLLPEIGLLLFLAFCPFVWLLLLLAWVRLLRTRYIYCMTNRGAALYSARIGQRVKTKDLSVSVGGNKLAPTAWFRDADLRVAQNASFRMHARSLVLFAEFEVSAESAEEAPVALDSPAPVAATVSAPSVVTPAAAPTPVVSAPSAPACADEAEKKDPEIVVIIREAEEREAARVASSAEVPVVCETAPVASEPVPAEVTEAPEEEDADEEEEATVIREVVTEDGKTVRMQIRYSRSFTARVIQAPDFLKEYYSQIKNELMSFSLVKSRISWKHDAFNRGRLQLAKLLVRGKTLCLYLALNPGDYPVEKYHQVDQSAKSAYAKVPMMVRIRSDLGLRKAKELIAQMMRGFGIDRNETENLDYASWYTYRDTKTLLEENLIKEFESNDGE